MTGIAFGESLRWHDGRAWFADWGAGEIVAVDPDGGSEVVVRVDFPSFPLSFDWLPDGRLLVVSATDGRLMRRETDGSLVTHVDLSALAAPGHPWNEIVVDGRGNAYVNNIGFNFAAGDVGLGTIAALGQDRQARQVADGLAFPNGMAVTPDNSTLIVGESYGSKLTAFDIEADGGLANRRTWAETPGDHPDGICIDAEGAVWYADVANRHCVRVREGGDVLQTVESDRGCFDCLLGGDDGRTLYIIGQEWRGPQDALSGERTGLLGATQLQP
jgi:sugar lactone lactonase YvrE